ncbi:hypothetical protein BG454_03645 [Roseinatronobacter bogoriensis subsp. barguzinensis]|uniref:Uncharacterized protein n=1 Tax=Roseinatronobacter bogoriensis subsp. barguzinensis TaxID=441209 RepID=A0A2K8K7Y3_9RHOB|nr:hypothetical protein BG454_03645 [Rhodobaca barguzinensis]
MLPRAIELDLVVHLARQQAGAYVHQVGQLDMPSFLSRATGRRRKPFCADLSDLKQYFRGVFGGH